MIYLKFDAAKQNAFHLMDNEEDKSFLRAQGEKGRRGSMTGGLDISLATKTSSRVSRDKLPRKLSLRKREGEWRK